MRYSGASIGYHLASIVAGGPAPLIAVWLLAGAPWPPGSHALLLPQYKGSYVPIAIYMVICAFISLVATVLIPDRSKVDISEEFDSAQPPERSREARRISPAG